MKLQALGTNVILRATTKKSKIAVDDKESETVETVRIFSIGKDCDNSLEIGKDVCILRPMLLQAERLVRPSINEEPVQGEFYITVDEKELIGIYE